jgi:hypothetical protein
MNVSTPYLTQYSNADAKNAKWLHLPFSNLHGYTNKEYSDDINCLSKLYLKTEEDE